MGLRLSNQTKISHQHTYKKSERRDGCDAFGYFPGLEDLEQHITLSTSRCPSVLMKIGIKSENHVCTIEIMHHILTGFFTGEECELLEEAREARVETRTTR